MNNILISNIEQANLITDAIKFYEEYLHFEGNNEDANELTLFRAQVDVVKEGLPNRDEPTVIKSKG